ncbi:MAG: preprotein translocase subunit SecE [Clostridia bacterium]|nr:preprotein translocase subunit SecE [Clostridia bacterium]
MADKQKKDNFFKRAASRIAGGAKSTKSEIKKISWPTRKQLFNNTGIVIICILVVAVFIFILDTVFGFGFSFLNGESNVSDIEMPTEMSTDIFVEDVTELVNAEVVTEPAE